MKRRDFLGFLAGLPFGGFFGAVRAEASPQLSAQPVVTELMIDGSGAERGYAQYVLAMNLARRAMESALAATDPIEGQIHSLDARYFFSCADFYLNRRPDAKARALRANDARLIGHRTFREDELVPLSRVSFGGRA